MQAFVDLLSNNKIIMNKILIKGFNFEEVKKAYNMILERKELFFCVLLNNQLLLK